VCARVIKVTKDDQETSDIADCPASGVLLAETHLMTEGEKLYQELMRYRVLRRLLVDKRAVAALDDLMKDDRLAQLDSPCPLTVPTEDDR
jgi:hypothetical protein